MSSAVRSPEIGTSTCDSGGFVGQVSKPAGPGSDGFGNPSDIIGGAAALSVSRLDMLIGTLMAWAVQLLVQGVEGSAPELAHGVRRTAHALPDLLKRALVVVMEPDDP